MQFHIVFCNNSAAARWRRRRRSVRRARLSCVWNVKGPPRRRRCAAQALPSFSSFYHFPFPVFFFPAVDLACPAERHYWSPSSLFELPAMVLICGSFAFSHHWNCSLCCRFFFLPLKLLPTPLLFFLSFLPFQVVWVLFERFEPRSRNTFAEFFALWVVSFFSSLAVFEISVPRVSAYHNTEPVNGDTGFSAEFPAVEPLCGISAFCSARRNSSFRKKQKQQGKGGENNAANIYNQNIPRPAGGNSTFYHIIGTSAHPVIPPCSTLYQLITIILV